MTTQAGALQVETITEPAFLSSAQIEDLLREAEERLRDHAATEGQPSKAVASKSTSIPSIRHNLTVGRAGVSSPSQKPESKHQTPTQPSSSESELRSIASSSKKVNDILDAGHNWYNMPKTELTPALKRDLQLIEMRNVLDPHRHYKKNTRKDKVPVFSQTGTVIEGPTEYYSGRINKKDRSQNFVEEAMRTERDNGRFKRKYGEIQASTTSGKKAYYKKLMAKRKKS